MADRPESTEDLIDRLVERSVERAVFGGRKMTLEKKGERGVITIDAKFLHCKEF